MPAVDDAALVIHGVANRDEAGFRQQVARLQRATGDRWQLIPVFWGDLGADDRWVAQTIPDMGQIFSTSPEIRDDGQPAIRAAPDQRAVLAQALAAGIPPTAQIVRDSGAPVSVSEVIAGALTRLSTPTEGPVEIRDGGGLVAPVIAADEVTAAIIQAWPSLTWLPTISDTALLAAVGAAAVAPYVDPAVNAEATSTPELREGPETRDRNFAAFVKRRMRDLDLVVGAAFSAAAGRLNTYLRTESGPGITRFFGDVLVYQRHRQDIHDRVWAAAAAIGVDAGKDPREAVRVIGHSLGGVIAFDIATAKTPLWTKALVTFGSQAPFFHVCDPRGGQLVPYEGTHLIQLPDSLHRWTNLWEPLDPLAFIAGRVFLQHDRLAPRDIAIEHLASSGLWTHSAYWTLTQVADAINRTFE
jgi:hypothetical protein